MAILIKPILDFKEFLTFYLPHADLFMGTLDQEYNSQKNLELKNYFVFNDENNIIGCFTILKQSIGNFALLERSPGIFKELLEFWKNEIKESIRLSISNRFSDEFIALGFTFKYSRVRMELSLQQFDDSSCTFESVSSYIQTIDIDSVSLTEAIVKTIFYANEGSIDQEIFNETTLELEKQTKLLFDIFHARHDEFTLIKDASFISKDSNSNVSGVILVTEWFEMPLIYEISVLKDAQGKKLGKKLLCRSIKSLKDAGYNKLALYVTIGNARAENLYNKLQFVPEKFKFCQLELQA